MLSTPVIVNDSSASTSAEVRGMLAGVIGVGNNVYTALPVGTEYVDTPLLPGRVIRLYPAGVGKAGFDITGPWR